LGTANPQEVQWPGGPPGYGSQLSQLEANLSADGYMSHRLINCAGSRNYHGIPPTVRTVIVPDRAQLTSADAEMLDAFVRRGGKVLAIGRGMGLAGTEEPNRAAPMFGLHNAGYASAIRGREGSFVVAWNNEDLSMPGPILAVRPTSAEPLLWSSVRTAGELPVITRNRVGKGTAYALTTTESAILEKPDFLHYLWTETVGEPLWKVETNSQRYLVRIRRQKQRYVLHVIDNLATKEGPMARYRPLYTRITINSDRIPFQKATVEPDNRPLRISTEGTWKTLEIYPDPELTIALE